MQLKLFKSKIFLRENPSNFQVAKDKEVAIGRAITRNPKLFLFDEPLSNLDAALRSEMRVEISKLHNLAESLT